MQSLLVWCTLATGACGRIAFEASDASVRDDAFATCAAAICSTSSSHIVTSMTDLVDTAATSPDQSQPAPCGAPQRQVTIVLIAAESGHYTIGRNNLGPWIAWARDGCCDGPLLGCTTASALELTLAAHQTASVTIATEASDPTITYHVVGGPPL